MTNDEPPACKNCHFWSPYPGANSIPNGMGRCMVGHTVSSTRASSLCESHKATEQANAQR